MFPGILKDETENIQYGKSTPQYGKWKMQYGNYFGEKVQYGEPHEFTLVPVPYILSFVDSLTHVSVKLSFTL